MDYNIFKKGLFLVAFLMFINCRNDDFKRTDCDPIADSSIDDLIIITPLQATYNAGDVINIKLTIPAQNNYFGAIPLNIYTLNRATFGELIFQTYASNDFFTGNSITIISGTLVEAPSLFYFPLNFNTGNYEFEINVTLNRLGYYKLPSFKGTSDTIVFVGNDFCKRMILATNKAGANADGNIEFVVQ